MAKTVAVIGAGVMGAPMAERVRSAGYDLIVCDINDETLEAFASRGAKTTRTPSECATADVILVIVASGQQTRDVVSGRQGVMTGIPEGRTPTLVVMGTVSSEVVCELADAVRPRGIHFLDAPISGGPLRAEEGTLAIMVGGEKADLEAVRPVFEAMSKNIFHCGPVGAGQKVKIINNLIGSINVIVVGEAFRIAVESGLDLADLTPVLEASSGRVNLSQDADEAYASYARWSRGTRDYDNVKMVMQKDMKLALDLAAESPGAFPASKAMMAVVDSMNDDTRDNWRTVGNARKS